LNRLVKLVMIGSKLFQVAKLSGVAPRQALARFLSSNPSISEASEALEHISHEEDEKEVEEKTSKMAPPKLDRERMSNLTYGIAGEDKLEAINRLLYASYHPDEPITQALGLFNGANSIPDADNRVGIMVRKNLSLFIYDEVGREVGVCVNCGFYKHDFLSLLDVEDAVDPNFRHYLAVHKALRLQNLNLFDELKTEKLFNISMVGVDPSMRGLGLATDLIRRSVLLAGTMGYTGIMTEATGSFSQRAFATIGMMRTNSVAYQDFEFDGKKVFRGMDKRHPEITMMKKRFFQSCLKHIM